MTKYIQRGRDWLLSDSAPEYKDELPVGTYLLNHDPMNGFHLSEIEDFTLPSKIYGKEIERHNRIIQTFLSRPASTGVILAGEKGAGKTLLSKRISIELAKKHGIATIVVTAPYAGDEFSQFIQSIKQPALIFFDEFEKVYEEAGQEALLTVLDGTMQSKKLFIVAINEVRRMSRFMLNRPGRFFYVFNYAGVPEDAIKEFLEDNLNDKSRILSVMLYSQLFRNFTFDMLSAIVEEMNRYDEPVSEVLKYLNVSMDYDGGTLYEVRWVKFKNNGDDERVWDEDSLLNDKNAKAFADNEYYNPLQETVFQIVHFLEKNEETGEMVSDKGFFKITPDDIKQIDKKGNFTFETDELIIEISKKVVEPGRPVISLFD